MKEELIKSLTKAAVTCGIENPAIFLDYPENSEHGDFSTNIAMMNAKKLGTAPKNLAEKIIVEFKKAMPEFVRDINVAGPGFINLFIKDLAIAKEAIEYAPIYRSEENVLMEYTDPNTFKVFHIGHLMTNMIGESISRLIEHTGAQVTRICYPSDIGLHISKAIWAIQQHVSEMPADDAPIQARTDFLGKMYVEGTNAYEADQKAKSEIDILNGVIYNKSDAKVNELYEKGRKWSLDHFELLYRMLGTVFNESIYESEMAPVGLKIVKDFLKKGVFEESDGAVVFKGDKYGLHTRVFINSHGLPTYEAKEIGLNVTKFKKYPNITKSIIVTASEQNDYFKVLTKVLGLIDENIGAKTKHIGHGMMRFATGKMSSRTGNVIAAETLLGDMEDLVRAKIADRKFTESEAKRVAEIIAVGAIRYTILRSSVGSDIIFDSAASISFEGDSGPYLQYSVVRANSIIEKAKTEGIGGCEVALPEKVGQLERLISRFKDMVAMAREDYAPQIIASYLITLAGAFNSFYASQIIVNKNDPLSPYFVALTNSFKITMTRGLWVLGIDVPEKM